MQRTPTPRQTPTASERQAAGHRGLLQVIAAIVIWCACAGLHANAEEPFGGSPGTAVVTAPGTVVTASTRRERMNDPLERFRMYSARRLIDPSQSIESLCAGGGSNLRPIVVATMDPLARRLLQSAFPLAVRRLRGSQTCRELYQELGTDGLLALATTVYLAPGSNGPVGLCAALDASAYTRVGQQTTVICPPFARLCCRRAAVTLLHEALHYAGLTEQPNDPKALTSQQISALVRERCDL